MKVADFGLLKHHEGMGVAMTTKVQGTFGYIDPEYYTTNRVTTKSDVYRWVPRKERRRGRGSVCSKSRYSGLLVYCIVLAERRCGWCWEWQSRSGDVAVDDRKEGCSPSSARKRGVCAHHPVGEHHDLIVNIPIGPFIPVYFYTIPKSRSVFLSKCSEEWVS